MKTLFLFLLPFALCPLPSALAGPLEDYCRTQFQAGNHNAAAVHAALLERTVEVGTTNRVRQAALVEDEVAFLSLVRSAPAALVTTNLWTSTPPADREELVQRRIERRILDATTVGPQNAAVVLRARLQILERRILTRGGDPYALTAGAPTETLPTETRGPTRWRTLGLASAPTPAEVRAALKP